MKYSFLLALLLAVGCADENEPPRPAPHETRLARVVLGVIMAHPEDGDAILRVAAEQSNFNDEAFYQVIPDLVEAGLVEVTEKGVRVPIRAQAD